MAALAAVTPAQAACVWDWQYSATGVAAAGTLTTDDRPDDAGFYHITRIEGQRNGVAIIRMQPAGTPIPGNEPYDVDNLIRAAPPHLTKHGIGFALGDGSHANPFFADFAAPPVYREFHAPPPGGGAATEPAVRFTATVHAP